jgi:hypothetical protein
VARSYLCGFEMNTTGEAFSVTGTVSVQSTITHSPGFALQVNAPGAAAYVAFSSRIAGGTFRSIFKSCRFFIYIVAAGSGTNCIVWSLGPQGGTPTAYLRLNNDLTLTVNINGTSGSSTLALETARWLCVELDVNTSANISTVRVDGVQYVGAGTQGGQAAAPEMRIGQKCVALEGADWNVLFDDVLADDADFTTSGFPGLGKQTLLIPTAGNNAGSWTDGAGGTGDIHGSVDNIPPTGVAASTAAAKIKNAVSGTTLDYVATMQTYLAGGIPAGSTVNAVMAMCNDGEEIVTGTKPGGLWIASNPAQSASSTTFDYGDDTATAEGTFPSGWATHAGVVSAAPSVTLATAPTVTVRKAVASTRVVGVDFLGMYVDYTPPPIGRAQASLQAVKRASIF